jgi:hypothetical protein
VEGRAGVGEQAGLLDGGLDHPGVAGAEVVRPGLRGAVDVLLAGVVPDQRAARLDQREFVGVTTGGLVQQRLTASGVQIGMLGQRVGHGSSVGSSIGSAGKRVAGA